MCVADTVSHYQKYIIICQKNLPCVILAKEKCISVYFDREKIQFIGLEGELLKRLKRAYPGIDVDSELNKMMLWLTSPRGTARKGTMAFIMGWLNRLNPAPILAENNSGSDTPLRDELDSYLKDLWKGREHLLEMNKRKS